MKKIVIASACRTAIGKFGGTLSNVPAAELGSIVIKEAIARAGITAEQVDHVYMGCVIQAGLGQNVARQASLKAGLPVTTPAVTVNVVCGSGLNCVNMAAQMIQAGDADIVVAGGTENMDMAPFAMMKGRYGYRMGAPMGKSELVDTMVNDALWDAFNDYHMGITAENVADQWNLSREDLDNFAFQSQSKAKAAIESGAFKDEIVPVVIKNKKGDIVFDTDEGPRLSPPEVLAKLRPAFKKDGKVTAGNASRHQRRRRRAGHHERGEGQGTGHHPHGHLGRRCAGRRRSLHHGRGPRGRHPQGHGKDRPDRRRYGSDRGQRSVRFPEPGRRA